MKVKVQNIMEYNALSQQFVQVKGLYDVHVFIEGDKCRCSKYGGGHVNYASPKTYAYSSFLTST